MSIVAHRSARPSAPARVAVVLLGGVGLFQLALVVGAPWGAAAWGGAHPGVLPTGLRAASAGSALVYGGLAATAGSARVPVRVRRRVLAVASGAMVLGTVANLASPSGVERAIWSPVAASLAVSLRLAGRDGGRRPRAPGSAGVLGRRPPVRDLPTPRP